MTSPSTAQINFPLDILQNTPDKNAPNTAPVKANGGIPMVSIRITPISTAQSREYHGPKKTEHTILIKCAIGHIPSTRNSGEITTPSATSIERTTIFNKPFELFIFLSSFRIDPKQHLLRAVENLFSPLTPKHGFPSQKYKTQGAPLLSARTHPGFLSSHPFLKFKQKKKLPDLVTSIHKYTFIFQASLRWHYPNQVIGRRSYLPLSLSYKLPSVQFFFIIHNYLKNCKLFL